MFKKENLFSMHFSLDGIAQRTCVRAAFRPILLLQKLVGPFHAGYLGQPQILDQPILIRFEAPLYASFGLW